jgi:hypothetical protein
MSTKKERSIFMTKLWDSLKNKTKTIYELTKEFPEKTYRELEKYRDADRREEAQRIITQQENEELKENQLTESQRRQMELEPIETESWEKKYVREHKLRQEAEGETTIVKGIGQNSPEMKAAKQKIEELQKELDRVKKENNELYNRIADLTNADSNLEKARESGL